MQRVQEKSALSSKKGPRGCFPGGPIETYAGLLRSRLLLLAFVALFAALTTHIANVVGVLHQPLVQIVAHALALCADEVDTLVRLVDPLAVENSALELLDPNTK